MNNAIDNALDPRQFIAEQASQTAYWSQMASDAATISHDALLRYSTRKAAAYARAFVGSVRDMLLANDGEAR